MKKNGLARKDNTYIIDDEKRGFRKRYGGDKTMKNGKVMFFSTIEKRLKEGKDAVIDGFGKFYIYGNDHTGKSVLFMPSNDLLERLENGPKCPTCHSRNVRLLPSQKRYICKECLKEWRV